MLDGLNLPLTFNVHLNFIEIFLILHVNFGLFLKFILKSLKFFGLIWISSLSLVKLELGLMGVNIYQILHKINLHWTFLLNLHMFDIRKFLDVFRATIKIII